MMIRFMFSPRFDVASSTILSTSLYPKPSMEDGKLASPIKIVLNGDKVPTGWLMIYRLRCFAFFPAYIQYLYLNFSSVLDNKKGQYSEVCVLGLQEVRTVN